MRSDGLAGSCLAVPLVVPAGRRRPCCWPAHHRGEGGGRRRRRAPPTGSRAGTGGRNAPASRGGLSGT